jgi:hypothetical protein
MERSCRIAEHAVEHIPLISIQNSAVIAGLDPAIHPLKRNAA